MAEYAFKHPLTQEVALGSQLQERRARVHAAVARAIEAAHAEKLDEHAALLAHHWEEAGEALAAARWHTRAARVHRHERLRRVGAPLAAGARAAARGAPTNPSAAALGAKACFAGAGARLPHRPSGRRGASSCSTKGSTGPHARTIRSTRAACTRRCRCYEAGSNRLDAAIRHASEWERVARSLPDEERRASALWPSLMPLVEPGRPRHGAGDALWSSSPGPATIRIGACETGASARTRNALAILGRIELYDGSLARAREHLERGVELARGVGDPEGEVFCWGTLGELGLSDRGARPVPRGRPTIRRASANGSGGCRASSPGSRLGTQLLLDGQAEEAMEALA